MGDDEKKIVVAASDTVSSFFSSSGDKPRFLITHVILNGDNYVSWDYHVIEGMEKIHVFGWIGDETNRNKEMFGLGNCEFHDCIMDNE